MYSIYLLYILYMHSLTIHLGNGIVLTLALTDKFVYIAHHLNLLQLNPFISVLIGRDSGFCIVFVIYM